LLPVSELAEVEPIAGEAEVFYDVGNDAARDITGMPRKCDEPVGTKRIGIVPVAAGGAE